MVLHKKKGKLDRKPDSLLSGNASFPMHFFFSELEYLIFLRRIMNIVKHLGLNSEL